MRKNYWTLINEALPNLKRNCIQLWGKHFLSNPFFPLQVGDIVLRNKHPETSFYTTKENDYNIEMIDRQCQHVALTLDLLPYHRPEDCQLLAIAQAVGMVPAADNSFKYQSNPKHLGKGARTQNVALGNQQWNDNQTKVLLKYVIANCGSGQQGGINWTNWDSDGVEGCKKKEGQNKLQSLKKKYKRMNEGDDRKTNDANTKQLYQSLLAKQLALESREEVVDV